MSQISFNFPLIDRYLDDDFICCKENETAFTSDFIIRWTQVNQSRVNTTMLKEEYGDPETEADMLKDLSPIHKIDAVITPTIVLHGANDTSVPVVESEQVVENLKLNKRWYLL